MPANPQPNWRDTGSEKPENKGSASRPWQPSDGPAGDSLAPSKRSIKRTIALFALIGIAIIFGAVAIWLIPAKPSCLVLIGSSYDTNLLLPPNVHGWNGLVQVEADVADAGGLGRGWSYDKPTKLRKVGDGPIELTDSTWSATWDKINEKVKGLDEKTIVLFISMHGMADDKEAYLIPNIKSKQALKAFDETRIPFRKVLDSLVKVEKRNVVLLLDVSHVQSYWPIGMLENDFVKRLKEVYEREIEATKHLTVICSAEPGQRSWTSDELQKTAFSHYVSLGLRGGGHKALDDVNALSLFKYVEDKVDKWAQANRARNQKPIMLGDQNRAKAVTLVHVATPADDETVTVAAPPLDRAKLQAAWLQWKELKDKHAPQVHSPHLWRLYQDTLLRYEYLMRAGDPIPDASKTLKENLLALHSEIAASRWLERASKSLGNSFPMYQVLGFPEDQRLPNQTLDTVLADLVNVQGENEKEKRKVILDRLFDGRNVRERQYLQTRVSQALLTQMANAPVADRVRKQAILDEIELKSGAAARAAELHLVKMLVDKDKGVDEKSIQLALRVRMLAEETALSAHSDVKDELYSEVIFHAIRPDMTKPDTSRRAGEDHLFGDPSKHGKLAEDSLSDAEKAYGKVRLKALDLQSALKLRDELSAELPYMAAWLASSHPHLDPVAVDVQRKEAEILGSDLKRLNDDLSDPKEKPKIGADKVKQMGNSVQSTREIYRKERDNLNFAGGAALPKNWHGMDTVLSVPPIETDAENVAVRVALLEKQRAISGELIRKTIGQADAEEADRVEHERKLFHASIKSLRGIRAGDNDDSVRNFFFNLPDEILTKAAQEGKGLATAANWCRGIPGAYVDFVKNEKGERVNPVERLRRTNMAELLQWQADRCLEDHWFDPAKVNTPYFETAAKAYMVSATELFEAGQYPNTLAIQARGLNEKLAYIKLNVPDLKKLYWTTESEFKFAYKVEAERGLPVGTPMVWLEVKRGDRVKAWPRHAMDEAFDKQKQAGKYTLDNANFAGDGVMKVYLHAYYRGQHVIKETEAVRATPDVIAKHTPALRENTKVASRMDSTFDYGAISIVLDTSYSMRFKYPQPKGGNEVEGTAEKKDRRFDLALAALDEVLKTVPEKTYVSIFGFKEPIYTIRSTDQWLKQDINDGGELRKRLAAQELDPRKKYGSPIADAITDVMTKGFPGDGFNGRKVIVVLTDGKDSASDVSREVGKPNEQVASLLKKANERPGFGDIAVVVVCFTDKGDPEYADALAQFSIVNNFGELAMESDGKQLGKQIIAKTRPRLQLKTLTDGDPFGFKKTGEPVNFRFDKSLDWKWVVPGTYRASVLQSSQNTPVEVELLSGQKVFMVFSRVGDKLSLRRGILGRQPEADSNRAIVKESKGWLASMFENENRGFGSEQLVTFEQLELDKDRVRQPHPGFVWLELDHPAGGAKPNKTLRWWQDWRVPASAYRLEMAGWPPQVFPKATAWFLPEEQMNAFRKRESFRKVRLPVGHEGDAHAALDNNALIESVEWRNVPVEGADGELVEHSCLVVRARHAPGRPVWIDLDTRGREVGTEHRFFTDANSCTAFFYGLEKQTQVNLTLMDIVDFKDAAKAPVVFQPTDNIVLPAFFGAK